MFNVLEIIEKAIPTALGAVAGYFIRFGLDKWRESKKIKQETSKKYQDLELQVKKIMDNFSPKAMSIDRDLTMLGQTYETIQQDWFAASGMSANYNEILKLSANRAIDNILIIRDIDQYTISEYSNEIGDLIRKYILHCEDVRRIIENKDDDSLKTSLIKGETEKIFNKHMEIISATRDLYSNVIGRM